MNALQVIGLTLLTIVGGSALVLLPYMPAGVPLPRWLKDLLRRSQTARLAWGWLLDARLALMVAFRGGPEQGGYVHDTAMSQFIPPSWCHYVTGTWTDAAGAVTGTIAKSKAAADNTGVITIPIALPSNSAALKGSYLKSVDIYWECLTAALDAAGATVVINKMTLPANTAAFGAAVTQAFTYDTGNDTAAETDDLDQHTMTVTLTTPVWIDNDDIYLVQLTMDAATTSAITFFGARANYTLRL